LNDMAQLRDAIVASLLPDTCKNLSDELIYIGYDNAFIP
jgi:hypothetical protein